MNAQFEITCHSRANQPALDYWDDGRNTADDDSLELNQAQIGDCGLWEVGEPTEVGVRREPRGQRHLQVALQPEQGRNQYE